ncbi:IclR family transcriptional regulator [Fusibacter paucivorans]|uniref:IclR family transcriptional regulator n=1 Tax=Fusibacter paucivorans TaxID=76009 RepID=A0ABS5PMS3_9FIRM|nr:IclR family transcriptional regulator [Fusibacter paucivorans]MBS7526197.1 IclR family transcriptional regulator [Fusibacter paucivorans]
MEKRQGTIQSVDRALSIIELLYEQDMELGVTEIAARSGLHKSTAFGLISTLDARGYITQNPQTGKYKLGLKFLEISSKIVDSIDERQIIRPYLEELSRKFGETVHYAVVDNDMVVYVDKVESPRSLVMKSYIGKRNPLHCTGVGKCMLAYMDDAVRDEIIERGLDKYTENTITDPTLLRRELDFIRRNGYSIDDEEIELGLRCVAAPILDLRGNLIGGISISGPEMRMSEDRVQALIEALKQTTKRVSKNVGKFLNVR